MIWCDVSEEAVTGTVIDSASAAVAFYDLLACWCDSGCRRDCGGDAAEVVDWWGG